MDLLSQNQKCRHYTTEEKKMVLALHTMGKSERQISQLTTIPKTTIHEWVTCTTLPKGLSMHDIQTHADQLKAELSHQLLINAKRCASLAMDETKTEKASSKDLALMTAIFADKHLTLSGKANQIFEFQHVAKQQNILKADIVKDEEELRLLHEQIAELED